MTKRDIAWLFAVIVLSILLVTSIILGATGFFSSVTYLSAKTDLVVGDKVTISVLPNQASVVSMTFDAAFLPNEPIPQVVQINAQNLDKDVRVRVKAELFGSESVPQFVTTEHFVQAEDGYYYFDEILPGGDKITFCNYILTPQNDEFAGNDKYIITIVAETLESQYGEEIWKTV